MMEESPQPIDAVGHLFIAPDVPMSNGVIPTAVLDTAAAAAAAAAIAVPEAVPRIHYSYVSTACPLLPT